MEALLASTDTLERENATLKSQLTHVQTQVLETRKLLDKRRQFDSEVDRWISTLKTDLTQTEFVAGLSHKDMDMTVDAMEMLKDRLSNVEDELTIERGRIGLLGASASRPKADKGVQAEVQVMTTGTYSEPIEIQTSLSIMPHSQPETLTHTSSATSSMVLHQEKTTSSFGSSLWRGFLWVSFASLLYSWVVNQSTNRQPDMLSLLLTWIDDLLDSSANELVLM